MFREPRVPPYGYPDEAAWRHFQPKCTRPPRPFFENYITALPRFIPVSRVQYHWARLPTLRLFTIAYVGIAEQNKIATAAETAWRLFTSESKVKEAVEDTAMHPGKAVHGRRLRGSGDGFCRWPGRSMRAIVIHAAQVIQIGPTDPVRPGIPDRAVRFGNAVTI